MAEYIEREAAIRALLNDAPEQVGYSREDAADCIRYMDAANVAPVRHGRWVEYENEADMGYHYCSECKHQAFNYDEGDCNVEILSDYCPNCGARMDGCDKNDE